MPGRAEEGWPGLHLGQAEVERNKNKERKGFNNNPTSGYHFPCLKSNGELRLPYPSPPLSVGFREEEKMAAFMVRKVIKLYLLCLPEPSTLLDQTH